MDKRKKVSLGLAIGCGAVAILCIGMAAGGLITGGLLVMLGMQRPENAIIHIDAPIQVARDEAVVIHIEVENVGAESQSLQSIDISSDYLAGIAIRHADPPFVGSVPVPFGDMESYTFQQQIPPGTRLDVEFSAVAIEAGDYAGRIDVCINSTYRCERLAIRTIVEE